MTSSYLAQPFADRQTHSLPAIARPCRWFRQPLAAQPGVARRRAIWLPPPQRNSREARTVALKNIIGIDHAVVMVRDLDKAADNWKRLGFTLSPRGTHSAH